MRVILVTIVITAIALWVYNDYDNIKKWFKQEKTAPVKFEEIPDEKPEQQSPPPQSVMEVPNPNTKYKEDDIVYIDAIAGDTLGFENNVVELWVTYDGSIVDDKQRVIKVVDHRVKCRVLKSVIGRNDETWYRVKTLTSFQATGWVREKFLSSELPKRRKGRIPDTGY